MLPEHEHVPDVKPATRMSLPGRMRGYAAYCSCGWEGEFRSSRAAAEEDASAHHLAEWPDDREGSAYR